MKMDVKNIRIQDYSYELPAEKIAVFPIEIRDQSKLLVLEGQLLTDHQYFNLPALLPSPSLLVFNQTKVIPARILFTKATGGTIEIFCLEPHHSFGDITIALASKGRIQLHCLVGGASKWKPGTIIEKHFTSNHQQAGTLTAKMIEKNQGSFLIEMTWTPAELSFVETLQLIGAIPLPPYIKREVDRADSDRYQTVYARFEGSVAAPTAGLHFTDSLMKSLKKKAIEEDFITLHVGAGTFKQVKSETMEGHQMHEEWIDVNLQFLKHLKEKVKNKIPVIAVGTTSLRTIESLYWIGTKLINGESELSPVSQWDPYQINEQSITVEAALEAIIKNLETNQVTKLVSRTSLLIVPGYDFKIVKGLITNFHQPQSTLLLLVAAFIGPQWKALYKHALSNNYRFLSYGDGCLLWKNGTKPA